MPIWKAPSVANQLAIEFVCWQILETDEGHYHFIGHDVGNRYGRVSTAIREFDRTALTGVTSSGRHYQLRGEPGMDRDAYYVWGLWATANGIASTKEVTEAVLAGEKLCGTR